MEFPGRILPFGGMVSRGLLVRDERFAWSFTGELIEFALPTARGVEFIRLPVEQAVAIADCVRWLTTETGKVYPSIQMFSGRYFDFLNIEKNEIDIEDVAHALSNICRFGGHGKTFYSVAEHSVRASWTVAPEHAYAALMHDSSEAVLTDIPTPIKLLLRDYQLLEEKIEQFMGWRFGYKVPLSDEVKHADLVMLATEKRDLKPNSDRWAILDNVEALKKTITPWTSREAYHLFLSRYEELTGIHFSMGENRIGMKEETNG